MDKSIRRPFTQYGRGIPEGPKIGITKFYGRSYGISVDSIITVRISVNPIKQKLANVFRHNQYDKKEVIYYLINIAGLQTLSKFDMIKFKLINNIGLLNFILQKLNSSTKSSICSHIRSRVSNIGYSYNKKIIIDDIYFINIISSDLWYNETNEECLKIVHTFMIRRCLNLL